MVVVADSSKFGQRALAPVCGLDEIDLIVTDAGLEPGLREPYGDRLSCIAVDGDPVARRGGDSAERVRAAFAAVNTDAP